MTGLTDALSFLTVLPVGRVAARPGAAAAWFPLVGALVGALAGGLRALALHALGGAAATVLALILFVALTGALHHDGLADAADALAIRGDRERRLAVMRDPRVGTFGALALIGWALLMLAALTPLSAVHGVRSLVAAAATGRCLALAHARTLAPARSEGLGASFTPTGPGLAAAAVLTLAGVPALCGLAAGAGALGVAALSAAMVTLWAGRVVGGRTGDTLGATVVLAEAAVCVTLLGFWR